MSNTSWHEEACDDHSAARGDRRIGTSTRPRAPGEYGKADDDGRLPLRVAVFGLGYVGSVSAACLARVGHQVTGVDVNKEKAMMINSGASPVMEPGLEELLAEVVKAGRLRATPSAGEAVDATDLALVCVGTPGDTNGRPNTDALRRVAREIGRVLKGRVQPYTVVVRSTILPGTTEDVLVPALLGGAGGDLRPPVRVAVNPEFIREGSALRDFVQPSFVLAGCDDPETASLMRLLYMGVDAPFIHTDVKTAEMVKYAANAFHALKVCFANEMGDVCRVLGIDAQEVMRIFRMDLKLNVSEAYLRPGFAFGGSCLPKDLRALLYAARKAELHARRGADVSLPLFTAILPSNQKQIRQAAEEVLETRRRRVGVVGLSFKPGTDDLRESPLVALVEILVGKGCDVRILDRNISIARLVGANRQYIDKEIPHVASLMCESAEALVEHAEVLVIGNAGEEASRVLAAADPGHTIVDLTRGAVRPRHPETAGV